jgi:hypothetical protein
METSGASKGIEEGPEKNVNIQPQEKEKRSKPTVKMEGAAYSSRGRNRPRMA